MEPPPIYGAFVPTGDDQDAVANQVWEMFANPHKPEKRLKTSVWIVKRGEEHEGSEVIGVFWSKEKAKDHARSQMLNTRKPDKWKKSLYWENGCDFICIEEVDVE